MSARARIRELGATDKLLAETLLREWGYPRPLTVLERDVSSMFAYGTRVLFWFNRDEDVPPRCAKLHVCIAPEMRGRAADRFTLYAIEAIAHLLDVDRLVMRPEPELARSLGFFGWVPARENRDGWLELALPPAAESNAFWWPGGLPGFVRVRGLAAGYFAAPEHR